MIPVPSGARVWLATGVTDMRRGMNTLALQVQQGLGRDPHAGDLFIFRGRKGDLVKILWHDGEHPVRTVCAAGAVLGVTLWNEVDGTRPLWMAFSVTPNIDAEDAASGGGQGAL